jgi:tetratricopeptide (TPR) repeat protein
MPRTHTGIVGFGTYFDIPVVSITAEDQAQLERLLDQHKNIRIRMQVRNKVTDGPVEAANVVGEVIGTEHPEQIIVVGGLRDALSLLRAQFSEREPAIWCEEPAPLATRYAIRAAGMRMGKDSSVQVQPLRDPAIDGFLNQAHAAETAKNFDAAAAAASRAIQLAPDAPDILQYQAEVEVLRGHWKEAEALAIKSFTLGPKVGSLCARNWQTVVEARIAFQDAATQAQAKQRIKECRVAPPVRM